MTKEPIISFLTWVTFLYQPNIYAENDDKDKKTVVSIIPFLSSFSLLIGKPQVESVDRMCVARSERTEQVVLGSISTLLMRRKYRRMFDLQTV